MKVRFSYPSPRKDKKYQAVFTDGDFKKTVHYGQKGAQDYTVHHDDERKARYINRHKVREQWDDYMSAGALSYHILWSEKHIGDAIRKYRQRFNLEDGSIGMTF